MQILSSLLNKAIGSAYYYENVKVYLQGPLQKGRRLYNKLR